MNSFFYLNAKATKRRNGYIVYLKEAEKIGDFLHIVGAVNAMLAFEDLRIMRDMRNSGESVSKLRYSKFEERPANAAAKQVEDIQLIEEKVGLENLPEKLGNPSTL
jgi:DNA-binding protein WhiA